MNFFFQMVLSGVMLGGIYSLIALGFVIIYKSSGVINFAQGHLVAVGALLLWTFLKPLGLPLWLGGLVTLICMALLGVFIEYLTIRPMTGQPLMAVIVMTIGLAALIDSLMPPIFGAVEKAYPPTFPSGGLQISGLSISYEYLFSFLTALVMVAVFLYFFHRTRLGLSMRAVADGHDTARSCGIRVGATFRWAWAIAAVSAMIGGFLLGNIESVSTAMTSIGLMVFPVVILGGLDSITGCIVAGPIVGILEMLAVGYADPITEGGAGEVMPYIIILVTLIFKPYGIFGQVHIERI
jgi:branched-chain amino acid transport system permease protein